MFFPHAIFASYLYFSFLFLHIFHFAILPINYFHASFSPFHSCLICVGELLPIEASEIEKKEWRELCVWMAQSLHTAAVAAAISTCLALNLWHLFALIYDFIFVLFYIYSEKLWPKSDLRTKRNLFWVCAPAFGSHNTECIACMQRLVGCVAKRMAIKMRGFGQFSPILKEPTGHNGTQ